MILGGATAPLTDAGTKGPLCGLINHGRSSISEVAQIEVAPRALAKARERGSISRGDGADSN